MEHEGDLKLNVLEWEKSLVTELISLYHDQTLCDLTLLSKEHYPIKMHSLVAYAASPWLGSQILKQQTIEHTIFVDVSKNILIKLVNFMYFGEICLMPFEISVILDIAQKMKLHQLVELLEGMPMTYDLTNDSSVSAVKKILFSPAKTVKDDVMRYFQINSPVKSATVSNIKSPTKKTSPVITNIRNDSSPIITLKYSEIFANKSDSPKITLGLSSCADFRKTKSQSSGDFFQCSHIPAVDIVPDLIKMGPVMEEDSTDHVDLTDYKCDSNPMHLIASESKAVMDNDTNDDLSSSSQSIVMETEALSGREKTISNKSSPEMKSVPGLNTRKKSRCPYRLPIATCDIKVEPNKDTSGDSSLSTENKNIALGIKTSFSRDESVLEKSCPDVYAKPEPHPGLDIIRKSKRPKRPPKSHPDFKAELCEDPGSSIRNKNVAIETEASSGRDKSSSKKSSSEAYIKNKPVVVDCIVKIEPLTDTPQKPICKVKAKSSSSNNNSYPCYKCNLSYTHANSLRRHMRLHADTALSCKTCNRRYETAEELSRHMKSHDKPYICDQCGEGFSYMQTMKAHIKRLHESSGYICAECGICCGQKTHLEEHMRSHKRERMELCAKCGQTFKYKRSLRRHTPLCTGLIGRKKPRKRPPKPPPAPSVCKVCAKVFSKSRYLQQHMAMHTRPLGLQCYKCGQQFRWRYSIKRHMEKCGTKRTKKTARELLKRATKVQDTQLPADSIASFPCLTGEQVLESIAPLQKSPQKTTLPEQNNMLQLLPPPEMPLDLLSMSDFVSSEQFFFVDVDKLGALKGTDEFYPVSNDIQTEPLCIRTDEEQFMIEPYLFDPDNKEVFFITGTN